METDLTPHEPVKRGLTKFVDRKKCSFSFRRRRNSAAGCWFPGAILEADGAGECAGVQGSATGWSKEKHGSSSCVCAEKPATMAVVTMKLEREQDGAYGDRFEGEKGARGAAHLGEASGERI